MQPQNIESETVNNDTISACMGFICFIKTSITLGLLHLYTIYKVEGWLTGLLNVCVSSIIGFSIIHLVASNINMLSQKRGVTRLKYSEAMEEAFNEAAGYPHAFGILLRHVTNMFLVFNHLSLCATYIIVTVGLWKEGFNIINVRVPIGYFSIIVLPPMIIFFCVNNFSKVAYFAVVGSILIAIAILVSLGFAILHIFDESEVEHPIINELIPLANPEAIILITGPIGLFLTIQYNLQQPMQFTGLTGVLAKGGFLSTIIHAIYGLLLFISYGLAMRCRVTFLFGIVPVGLVVNLMISLSIYVTYPMHSFVVFDIIWNIYLKEIVKPEHHKAVIISICVAIAIITVIPIWLYRSLYERGNLNYIYSTLLALFWPALMDLLCKYNVGYGPLSIYLVRDSILIIFFVIVNILPFSLRDFINEDCFTLPFRPNSSYNSKSNFDDSR